MAEPDDLTGRMLGEFVLRERIDEGGFGAVYRCVQPLLGRDAVVKVLHPQLRHHEVAIQRFMREARLASLLDHPYAAHVYAFGAEPDGLLWIAMERVQGTTLNRWLRERGPISLEQFLPLFDRIAQVVQVAHERGIVHRDLKPSNVMIVERVGQLLPKLVDFGIAKLDGFELPQSHTPHHSDDASKASRPRNIRSDLATLPQPVDHVRDAADTRTGPPSSPPTSSEPGVRERLTRADSTLGSPPYMSPEQWNAPLDVGPSSDLYALGVVAYEVLTGRRPYHARTTEELVALHRYAVVPAVPAHLPRALDKVFERALAKHARDRYGSAIELAAALRAAAEEGQRHAARRAAWIRGGLVVTALVGAVTATQYRAMLRADMSREIAEQSATVAELEQGRQALLHGEYAEAQQSLLAAYERGERSPATLFMLARALQPRLAEQVRLGGVGRMWSAAYAPDGERVMTSDDAAARIWNPMSGHLLLALPHRDTVYHAVFGADGSTVVSACGDGAVRIWDATTGVLVSELRGEAPMRYVQLATSGDIVAAIDGHGKRATVWRTGTSAVTLAFDGAEFPAIAISIDGRWLAATGGEDVKIYATSTLLQVATIDSTQTRAISIDPTGARIAIATAHGDASIWEIPSGRQLHHLQHVGEAIDAMAFSADGARLVLGKRDGSVQVWNASNGELVSQGNHLRAKILTVEFDRDAGRVVAATSTGSVAIIDAATGMPTSMLDGSMGPVRHAHFAPSGAYVVGASWDGTARVWASISPYEDWRSPTVADGCGIVTGADADGRYVAVGCPGRATTVWDTATHRLLSQLPPVNLEIPNFAGARPVVGPSGEFAAVARGKVVQIHETASGRMMRAIVHDADVSAVAFGRGSSSAHPIVISGAVDGSIVVATGHHERVDFPRAAGGIDAVASLIDGRVITADATQQVRIYGADHKIDEMHMASTRLMSLRPSPDGRSAVAIPSFQGKVAQPTVWTIGHDHAITLEGHIGQVFSARWISSGREILTAGGDGTARRWDARTGRLIQTYRGGGRFIGDADLSPDGEIVAGGDADGILRFWDAKTGRPLWRMRGHGSHIIGVRYDGDALTTRGFGGDLAHWTLPSLVRVFELLSEGGWRRTGARSRATTTQSHTPKLPAPDAAR